MLETIDEKDIIVTDEEVGNIPYFLIEDEYGVATGYDCDVLVIKKIAGRRGKAENGENPDKVYQYIKWEELKYLDSFEEAVETYEKVKERKLNSNLIKSQELQELINIRLSIQNDIRQALQIKSTDSQIKRVCNLTDTIKELKEQVREVKQGLAELNKLKDETMHDIKEARKIIVERDKPKQRRYKKED